MKAKISTATAPRTTRRDSPLNLTDPTGLDWLGISSFVADPWFFSFNGPSNFLPCFTCTISVTSWGSAPGGVGGGGPTFGPDLNLGGYVGRKGDYRIPPGGAGSSAPAGPQPKTPSPAEVATTFCQDNGQHVLTIPGTNIYVTMSLSTTVGPANVSSTNDVSAVAPLIPWPEWFAFGASVDLTFNAHKESGPYWSLGSGRNLAFGAFITPQGKSQGLILNIGPSVGPPANVSIPANNVCGLRAPKG